MHNDIAPINCSLQALFLLANRPKIIQQQLLCIALQGFLLLVIIGSKQQLAEGLLRYEFLSAAPPQLSLGLLLRYL